MEVYILQTICVSTAHAHTFTTYSIVQMFWWKAAITSKCSVISGGSMYIISYLEQKLWLISEYRSRQAIPKLSHLNTDTM